MKVTIIIKEAGSGRRMGRGQGVGMGRGVKRGHWKQEGRSPERPLVIGKLVETADGRVRLIRRGERKAEGSRKGHGRWSAEGSREGRGRWMKEGGRHEGRGHWKQEGRSPERPLVIGKLVETDDGRIRLVRRSSVTPDRDRRGQEWPRHKGAHHADHPRGSHHHGRRGRDRFI